jgi:hypothetical protein
MFQNKGLVSIIEILFITAILIPMIVMGILGMWPLFFVFLAFNIIFGITELLYVKYTGLTISQHFWNFAQKSRWKAIVVLASMIIMWIALILHLGLRMFS